MQSEKIKQKVRENRIKKNICNNPINNNEINQIIKMIKDNDIENKLSDIYANNDYFIKFIELLQLHKNRLLRLNEIGNIFNVVSQTIKNRIFQLNLEKYFYIYDPKLELYFKNFLENNNFNNKYLRHARGILSINKNTLGHSELDFYLKEYNLAFEINDIGGHNSTRKDQYYHYNKTLQCKEKDIRLIHLWEWELIDEDLWCRTSNWILNLLNFNKIQIDVKNCIIKEINIEEEKEFLNKYNLYNYIESDIALGLYHNNELLQVMTFKRQIDNNYELLRFSTKYNHEINSGTKELLDYFIKKYNPELIITTINLDKFIGKTFEELRFKLIKYKKPELISHNNNGQSPYKSIYNCGQNIYILNC